jgi:hypothetical protein
MLNWLMIFVILFEIWYGIAYITAFVHVRENAILLQVGQAVLMMGVFVYLLATLSTQQPISQFLVLGLLLATMIMQVAWRRLIPSLTRYGQSYPRGLIDVLSFRRRQVDLKRRVRTK